MSTPSHNKPYPGCRTILNFGSPFHGNHFYILSLSYLHPGVENLSLKDINNAFLLHDIYLCPISRTLASGSCNLQLLRARYFDSCIRSFSYSRSKKGPVN